MLLWYFFATLVVFWVPRVQSQKEEFTKRVANALRRPGTNEALSGLQVKKIIEEASLGFPSISEECSTDLFLLQDGLDREELWANKMLDSSSRYPPAGFLDGNVMDYGHYDECISILNSRLNISGRHCVIIYDFQDVEFLLKPFLSYCIPSSCSESDIDHLVNKRFDRTPSFKENQMVYLKSRCSKVTQEYSIPGIVTTLLVILAFVGPVTLFTLADLSNRRYGENSRFLAFNKYSDFSIITSVISLLKLKVEPGTFPVLHGLRVISMFWITLLHQLLVDGFQPFTNYLDLLDTTTSWLWALVYTGIYSVDTFFVISGFLVCISFVKEIDSDRSFSFFTFYIRRYIRLTPPILILLLLAAYIAPFIGSGPKWDFIMSQVGYSCEERMLSVLTYLQNFLSPSNLCLAHLWHMGVDMQLYWISPLIMYPLIKMPKLGYLIIAAIVLASSVVSMQIVVDNQYPTVMYEPGSKLSTLLDSLFYHYMTPYVRAGPYFIGILFGYITATKKFQLSKATVWLGWLISISGIVYTIGHFKVLTSSSREFNAWHDAIHSGVSHPIWAFGVAWLIYMSINGFGGLFGELLSLRIFMPLSKLSYCYYLLHLCLQSLVVSILRFPRTFFLSMILINTITTAVLTIGFAAVLYVYFDSPAIILEKRFRQKRSVKKK